MAGLSGNPSGPIMPALMVHPGALTRRESRADFMARLRRTALRLPARFINESIMGMRLRCQRLLAAKGGLIEEGPK